jgi:hypothetical protein
MAQLDQLKSDILAGIDGTVFQFRYQGTVPFANVCCKDGARIPIGTSKIVPAVVKSGQVLLIYNNELRSVSLRHFEHTHAWPIIDDELREGAKNLIAKTQVDEAEKIKHQQIQAAEEKRQREEKDREWKEAYDNLKAGDHVCVSFYRYGFGGGNIDCLLRITGKNKKGDMWQGDVYSRKDKSFTGKSKSFSLRSLRMILDDKDVEAFKAGKTWKQIEESWEN